MITIDEILYAATITAYDHPILILGIVGCIFYMIAKEPIHVIVHMIKSSIEDKMGHTHDYLGDYHIYEE